MKIKELFKWAHSEFNFRKISRNSWIKLPIVIGFFNSILALTLVIVMVNQYENLLSELSIAIYITYSVFVFYAMLVSLWLFVAFNDKWNKREKNMLLLNVVLSPFGLNVYVSINAFLKSGLSLRQFNLAIWNLRKNKTREILARPETQKQLTKDDKERIKILYEFVSKDYETENNINALVLRNLKNRKISVNIDATDDEIIELGKYL